MATLREPPRRQSAAPQGKSADQASILYVEDEDVIRMLAERALAGAGYAVTTAADGLEGWNLLAAKSFDLVVTDHDMPRLTGMELVTRAYLEGLTVPFIVASGAIDRLEITQHQGLHLTATLRKPFGSGDLVAVVRRVLGAASGGGLEQAVFAPDLAEVSRRAESDWHWGVNARGG